MNDFYVKQDANKSPLRAHIEMREPPFTVKIIKGVKRSTQMNNLLHDWFGLIALHRGDVTPRQVKAECNLRLGVPIKRRDDPEWNEMCGGSLDVLPYAAQIRLFEISDVPMTRNMTTAQLSEYMADLDRECAAQGIHLTNPDDLKWRGKQ